ncbi:DUF881 domain-containing protein [Nocardioides caeni]|nr:DUF881 domain-containing protein [Nocardioides caeni]
MTGTQTEAPAGRPPGRTRAWRIGTPVVGVLSGALLAVSAVNADGTDLRPGRYTDLAGLVQAEAEDYQRVEERFTELSEEVDRLGADVDDERVEQARDEIDDLQDPAGMTPRSGEGLTITLSDSPDELFEAAIEDDTINLNRYVVHQQDIQAVVNALWSGGATAVTIAGQRVISTTGIKCRGNAVQLQGVPYPQPYVIQAVGDQVDLLDAVDGDPLVTGYRDDSVDPAIGIGWEMETEDAVTAPAYDGLLDLQYARPLRR